MRGILAKYSITLILLLIGVGSIAYISCLPDDAVFFLGDGGLKYLMSRQYLQGNISPELVLPNIAEAEDLWRQGFYPFDVPFVYQVDDQRWVSFPLYFPLASTPFLAGWGWKGLYVLPVLGVLSTWVLLLVCLKMVQIQTWAVNVALVSVLFASHLSLYGGMYWEHTLATFFASIPLIFLLRQQRTKQTIAGNIAIGVLSGLGVFLRPESLVYIIVILSAGMALMKKDGRAAVTGFAAGLLISIGVFFFTNRMIYGHALGLHSAQVLDGYQTVLLNALVRTYELAYRLCLYWPPYWFILLSLPVVIFTQFPNRRELLIYIFVLVISVPAIALIVPNTGGKQWGPRYLLVLVPLGGIVIGLLAQRVSEIRRRWIRVTAILLLFISLAIGVKVNVWDGTKRLASDYEYRVLPALRILRDRPEQFVLISHQWIAQELADIIDEKAFLRATTSSEVKQLMTQLSRNGVQTVLYVALKDDPLPEDMPPGEEIEQSSSYIILSMPVHN